MKPSHKTTTEPDSTPVRESSGVWHARFTGRLECVNDDEVKPRYKAVVVAGERSARAVPRGYWSYDHESAMLRWVARGA